MRNSITQKVGHSSGVTEHTEEALGDPIKHGFVTPAPLSFDQETTGSPDLYLHHTSLNHCFLQQHPADVEQLVECTEEH